MKKMFQLLLCGFCALNLLMHHPLRAETPTSGHTVDFREIAALEFLRFVSKVSGVTFIFDERTLDFNLSLISGSELSPEAILVFFLESLHQHHIYVERKNQCYILRPMNMDEKIGQTQINSDKLIASSKDFFGSSAPRDKFHVYKLQYNQGNDMVATIKQIAQELRKQGDAAHHFLHAVSSLQWVQSTNSLLYSGDAAAIEELSDLIARLDKPQKQVFIEVLVVETLVKNGLEFGLEWSSRGNVKDKLSYGIGNLAPNRRLGALNEVLNEGGSFGKGFNLGVIGDMILHKGKTFFNLASLVSALQSDGNATIVLNQKIITQDNKSSSIFVGDNIPFTGSVVQTIGASQQTTSNIEYRDIGVSLKITPLLGDQDIITLDLTQEITEAREDLHEEIARANGIQTTKTNMLTRVHVPNEHFLVLSGMSRNAKTKRKTGVPCLGGLPFIGAAFSKNHAQEEKKNIIIFVRPQIIHSFDEYENLSKKSGDRIINEMPSKELIKENIE